MNKTTMQPIEKPETLTPRKKTKREKLIRVTDETYTKIAKMGDLTEDFEDVVARLVKFWEDHHKERA